MNAPPTCSLSEAITYLAFNAPISATVVPIALNDGRWNCTRDVALSKLHHALNVLCNAGYNGSVQLWGRTVNTSSSATPEPLRCLSKAECIDYRLIVLGRDALWQGKNQLDEFRDAFAAYASSDRLEDVRVDMVDLDTLKTAKRKSHRIASKQHAALPLSAQTGSKQVNKKKRLPDPNLKRWWDSLSDTERDLPRDELHKRCLAAHPENSIARQRVRDFGPKRKPGPRPIAP